MAKCSAFNALGVNTRMRQASTLNRFSAENRQAVALLDRKIGTALRVCADAGLCATCLITLRPLMQWAMSEQLIEADPTLGIKIKLPQTEGHLTWSEEQIAQFELRWPIGSMEQLRARARGSYRPASQLRHQDGAQEHPRWRADVEANQENESRASDSRNPGASRAGGSDRCLHTVSGHTTFLVKLRGKPFSERELIVGFAKLVTQQACRRVASRTGCARHVADASLTWVSRRIASRRSRVTSHSKRRALYENVRPQACG